MNNTMKHDLNNQNKWDLVIKAKKDFLHFNFRELVKYRWLIFLFIKRDFVTFYKQTILGPLWYIIQPLVNTIVFTIIFGNIAKIPTDGLPPFLFYMAGTIAWGYFATCLTMTSNTFIQNADIFGKVYFPRITVPISNVVIGLLQFAIQFSIFLGFILYFYFNGFEATFSYKLFYLPLLVLQMAFLGLGFGILISSLTTKYRDLTFVMSFGVQLWMYATPVVYPLSIINENYRFLAALNPMTSVVECFREIFFNNSSIEISHIFISITISIVIFVIGYLMFNRMERNFMDTI